MSHNGVELKYSLCPLRHSLLPSFNGPVDKVHYLPTIITLSSLPLSARV